MSEDVLVINTEAPKGTAPVKLTSEPLVVFDDKCSTLKEVMPEFDVKIIKNAEVQNFIERLKKAMVQYNGLGLSANQCGYRLRMFVMGTSEDQIVCINPRILEKEEEPVKMREGCLSHPGLFLNVPRYSRILVAYHNDRGEEDSHWLEGMTAQVFQHELDHMNGIDFTDHVKPLALRMAKEKQTKLLKKIKRMK